MVKKKKMSLCFWTLPTHSHLTSHTSTSTHMCKAQIRKEEGQISYREGLTFITQLTDWWLLSQFISPCSNSTSSTLQMPPAPARAEQRVAKETHTLRMANLSVNLDSRPQVAQWCCTNCKIFSGSTNCHSPTRLFHTLPSLLNPPAPFHFLLPVTG